MKYLSLLLLFPLFYWSCAGTDTTTEKNSSPEEATIEIKDNDDSDSDKDYTDSAFPSESGMVKFKHEGSLSGTEVWYWAEWGDKQRKESNTLIEMMGIKQEQNTVTLILDDKIYGLDEGKKTATLITADLAGDLSDMKYEDEEIMKQMGGKKVGTEEVLGKTCEVWELSNFNARVAAWHGLALHSTVEMMGMSNEITATEIDLKYSPDGPMFDISDYKVTDMGSIEDLMKKI